MVCQGWVGAVAEPEEAKELGRPRSEDGKTLQDCPVSRNLTTMEIREQTPNNPWLSSFANIGELGPFHPPASLTLPDYPAPLGFPLPIKRLRDTCVRTHTVHACVQPGVIRLVFGRYEAGRAPPQGKRRRDRKSTRLNSSHIQKSRMPSSA